MGKHKYHTSLLVVEEDAVFRAEILKTLQRAFKRKVLVRTAPSVTWALKMDTVPDLLIVDVVSDSDERAIIRDALAALITYLTKHPQVQAGLMGFFSEKIAAELNKIMPELAQRIDVLAGPCLRLAMEEFVSKHVKGGTPCST